MENKLTISFLGGAGTVTGSKYLIQTIDKNILVDCGLFQGLKKLRLLNWKDLPFDASKIDLVLLTHGHLDHVGYLPRLVDTGFTGQIWGTLPTLDVARIILLDCAKIQEEDAERSNAVGYTKHSPAKPLYNLDDVEKTLRRFYPQALKVWIKIADEIQCRFRYNGHIIGATFIELKIGNRLLVFSGDIGRNNDPLLYPSEKPEQADILFIESTYGGRIHPSHPEETLARILGNAADNNGTIIIPSFAVERTQMLMYLIWQLRIQRKIPKIPVYMDSPMGRNILELFRHNTNWHKLTPNQCDEMSKEIKCVQTIADSIKLVSDKNTKIVIAGGGMASGGRVLNYFQQYLGDRSATILFIGYQAEGTRGRELLEGAHEIKLYGKYYSVKARIENIQGLSAHADQKGLIDWMRMLKQKPGRIFIVHGEPGSADALRVKIKDVYGWDSEVPELDTVLTLI